MDNEEGSDKLNSPVHLHNIQNEPRHDRFNLPHESDRMVASQNVIDETTQLYLYHLMGQMIDARLRFPIENTEYLIPENASSFQTFVNQFMFSPRRRWVYEQAQNVDLESLNCVTFYQLMNDLFEEGGEMWEKVLILFYFCSDLSIRALREKFVGYFIRLYNWTTSYFARRLSVWVEQQGGWDVVLQKPVDYLWNLSILGVCAVGVLLLCLYIRSR